MNQSSAVGPVRQQAVVKHEDAAQDLSVRNIAHRADVERVEATITLPPDYQYVIPKWEKDDVSGKWVKTVDKIGITADGYEYLNRVVGCTFFLPDFVPDRTGEMARNPIVQKDYIRLRMGAVWYNALGQLIGNVEDIETDFNLVWQDARVNSKSAEVIMDPETGQIAFDDFGNAALKLAKEDELKALKTLSQLRTFGLRYAQTVVRVRLLKMAVGVRSLPGKELRPYPIKVVGFRDKMTPTDRVARATSDSNALFGNPVGDVKPLSRAEMEEIGDPDPNVELIDQNRINVSAPFTSDDLAEGGIK
jgi:hypothetical protein